jgi:cellulose synthase/poly-beta-1,6-N-acetylglucosamine synthase-like glycosyltransferase
MWTWLLALIYLICLLIIFGYALVQGTLAVLYLKAKKKNAEKPKALIDFPIVTIQLPVFNEKYVVDRLIKTVVQMDYPKDKLEIQILDDSTDETSEIIAKG